MSRSQKQKNKSFPFLSRQKQLGNIYCPNIKKKVNFVTVLFIVSQVQTDAEMLNEEWMLKTLTKATGDCSLEWLTKCQRITNRFKLHKMCH